MISEYDSIQLSKYSKFCTCIVSDCRCGENNVHEWTWDKKNASYTATFSDDNLEVKFHGGYSFGTAAARGNKLLEKGKHHYWEVKMITAVYGTDVMVGVGTSKVDLSSAKQIYCSLLGRDQESFGFSYKGYIQYKSEIREYGSRFGEGSLVGMHLDTWKGTLQFFLNRKPLGIAFTGLQDIKLYPMVSSTAALSKMRLTYSCSIPVSLQTECLALLNPTQKSYINTAFPGLRYLSESIFADVLKKNLDEINDETNDLEFPAEYMILDDFDFALVGFGRKKKKKHVNNNFSVPV